MCFYSATLFFYLKIQNMTPKEMDKEKLKKQLAALRENYEMISKFLIKVEVDLFYEETISTYLRLESYKIESCGFSIFAQIYTLAHSFGFPDINIGKIEIYIPSTAGFLGADIRYDEYGKLQNFNTDANYTFDIAKNGDETHT